MRRVINTIEIRERLGCSLQYAQELCRSGRIEAIDLSVGKKRATWVVTEEAFERFLNPHRDTKPAKKATRQARIDAGVQRVYE
ncbi:MAG TPA: hypothetical protein DDZ51_05845 [Planctomycetaceae bacterium]|nr:hypothetical protein [Planctomycetaceae bacterium]